LQAVIPVPRSEVFCQLKIGSSFRFDEPAGCYVIDVAKNGMLGKTNKATFIKLPKEVQCVVRVGHDSTLLRIPR